MPLTPSPASHVLLIGTGALGRAVLADLIDSGFGNVTIASHRPGDDPVVPLFEPGKTFDLLLDADLVIETSGDATTRYLANDAAAIRAIPMVWGEVDAHSGRVGLAWDERGVDYRDVDPVPVPLPMTPTRDPVTATTDPAPSTAGATAPPHAIAAIAALITAEAVTALTGNARPGKVVAYDVASGMTREDHVEREHDADRPGSLEERTAMTDHVPSRATSAAELALELTQPDAPLLLDVREPWEAQLVSIPDSTLIPLGQLADRLGELDKEAPVVLYCHHGVRSDRALAILEGAGFTRARHLSGGIDAWSVDIDPSLPRY